VVRAAGLHYGAQMDATIADRLAIRDVVETWVNARDSGDWEAFRACWHEDGYMMATWFQGPKEDFIRVSQEGQARGVNILHYTGGCRITLAGTRAIAQTRMTIMQRGEVHGVLCDVACTGRFYDFFEKRPGGYGGTGSPPPGGPGGYGGTGGPPVSRGGLGGIVPPETTRREGRWGIVLRQPIYEKDRLDPVDPAASLALDPDLLARYPEGYHYLAYLQVQAGYPVKPDMPGLHGPETERLYARGAAWLAGQPGSP
jgi:SnoaL-like domain